MGVPLGGLSILLGLFYLCGSPTEADPLSGSRVEQVSRSGSFRIAVAIGLLKNNKRREETQICSGILISPKHVLTTERCINGRDLSELVVYTGSTSLRSSKTHLVCEWTPYNQHNSVLNDDQPLNLEVHDIGVVKLCDQVDDVTIPPLTRKTIDELQGTTAIMIGWGKSGAQYLNYHKTRASVGILDPCVCQRITQWRSFESGRNICTAADPFILATPRDYGGPLLINHQAIAGLTTGVYELSSGAFSPGINIHANLTYYRDFIQHFTG